MPGFLNDGFLGGKGKGGGARGEPGKTPTIGPNGNWFIGGVDSGQSAKAKLDLSKFKQNEVVTVDAKTGELKPSGVLAGDGEVTTEPDSVIIGAHEWSSSAENMTATNTISGKVYSPMWQEVKPKSKYGYVRQHSKMRTIDRFTDQSTRVDNPSFDVTVLKNETAFSVDVVLADSVTNLIMEVYSQGKKLYRSRWKSKPAGPVNLVLNSPSDFRIGNTYTVKFLSSDGVATLMGGVNGNPKYTVNVATWTDVQVATKNWVNALPSSTLSNPVTHVSLIGSDKLQMTHADGTKNVLALPSQGGTDLTPLRDEITMLERSLTQQGNDITGLKAKFGNLEHAVDGLHSTYVYTGAELPAFPDEVQGRYFITLKGQAAREIVIDMPDFDSGDIKDGTMFYLSNDNAQAKVTLESIADQTIGGASTIDILPNHQLLMFKNGDDWVVAMNKPTATVATQISPEDIRAAQNRGDYPSGSLKQMGFGWWSVKASSVGVTGKPNDSQGDLVVMHQKVSGVGGKNGYGVMLAFGQDTNGKDAVWAQYRDGTKWTTWFKVNSGTPSAPVDLSAINKAIADTNTRVASLEQDVPKLKTEIGDIYAPDKVAFDAAVNALIDTKLAAYKPGGGGGGDHPQRVLPTIYASFANNVPTSLTGAVSSTNGEATLIRIPSTRSRVFILVENDNDEASKVKGISVDGGMSASWQPRDTTIDGKKYRAFYSAGAYSEKTLKLKVDFGQG